MDSGLSWKGDIVHADVVIGAATIPKCLILLKDQLGESELLARWLAHSNLKIVVDLIPEGLGVSTRISSRFDLIAGDHKSDVG